jgi:hypothetical protein
MPRKKPVSSSNIIVSSHLIDGTNTEINLANYIKIQLLGGKSDETFLISLESLPKVIQHNWYYSKSGYPKSYTARYHTLHRFLLGRQEKGMVIDHINRNKMDNRLENLRVITQKENSYNRTKNANSLNKYKGIVLNGSSYDAVITKDKKKYILKGFETAEDAASAYDAMAEELFGEFAGKNFV